MDNNADIGFALQQLFHKEGSNKQQDFQNDHPDEETTACGGECLALFFQTGALGCGGVGKNIRVDLLLDILCLGSVAVFFFLCPADRAFVIINFLFVGFFNRGNVAFIGIDLFL